MKARQAVYPTATTARVLEVSRSGFHASLDREPSARALGDAALKEEIGAIQRDNREAYGAPRVHAELQARGERASRKRAARLMRALGLRGASRRKREITTVRGAAARPAPDLVDRDFRAEGPNRPWVADVTYVPTGRGTMCLAAVVDAFSRRVVGRAMRLRLFSSLVLDALEMAAARRRPTEAVRHSDQGSQCASAAFGALCRRAGVRPSMGSAGDCYDNAMAESFFATLECELLEVVPLADPEAARREAFAFIEGWRDPRRRRSALGYESPMECERRFGGPA